MAFYMSIRADQRPFDLTEDDNFHNVFVCNYTGQSFGDVDTWEDDLVSVITGGFGLTFGTEVFIGPRAILPDGDGPFVTVVDTGGARQDLFHDTEDPVMENLSAQITVHDRNFQSAQTLSLGIWRALVIHNTEI